MDKNYYCVKCGTKYTSAKPKVVAATCHHEIVHESARNIINILNTIEDCTIVDAPNVIKAIRADTMRTYSKI